jgi:hypothetical protein
LSEWVRTFIAYGDAGNARFWGERLAHCGHALLDGRYR